MQADTFGPYVRRRLEHWGDEFSLARDCEYLGHQSVNMLYVLMEHHGMPGKATGYKPLSINAEAQQIEDIVAEISRRDPIVADCMRAYYCGSGRRRYERFDAALLLVASRVQNGRFQPFSRNQYLDMVRDGDYRVRNALEGMSRAA